MKNSIFTLFLMTTLLVACSSDSQETPPQQLLTPIDTPSWLVPIQEVKDGGPGKDGIPSIDNPIYIPNSEAIYMIPNLLVLGIIIDGVPIAFPHIIMDWHEVVNDNSTNDNINVTLSYCPLTGTAFSWESVSNSQPTTFGVSGLLYNANLILYDRLTDSNWSQLRLECINGSQITAKPRVLDVVETNWGTWLSLFPNTKVLSPETGFSRNYGIYPYGDYKTNHERFIFSASPSNGALPNKQRVFAIIDDTNSKVYKFEDFIGGKSIIDTFKGKTYLIVGNENILRSFELSPEHLNLTYEYDFNGSESFIKDNEGNKWSVFGRVMEGPRLGENLTAATSVVSYWFAIAAFYPNPEIY